MRDLSKIVVNLTIFKKLAKIVADEIKGVPVKIDHTLFVRMLKARGITQKAFADYAKISYDTVTGWKKKGKVPAYAMVIAKDMAYRKTLDTQAQIQMKRRYKKDGATLPYLLPKEQKRIEAAFWGSNHTAGEIIQKVGQGEKKFAEQFRQNVPQELQKKIMDNLHA